MDVQQAYQQSIEPQDKFTPNRTLYDASYGEIMARNFLAGVSRALGGIILYLIFLVIAYNLFITVALPHIQPFINEYMKAVETINKLNSTTTMPGAGRDAQQFLQDLQDSLPR